MITMIRITIIMHTILYYNMTSCNMLCSALLCCIMIIDIYGNASACGAPRTAGGPGGILGSSQRGV